MTRRRKRRGQPRVKSMWWIAAYTHRGKEQFAKEQIENQGYEAYVPEYYDEYYHKVKTLFPGFVFVKISGHWGFLNGTKGVYRPIMMGETPAKLPLRDMRALRQLERGGVIEFEEKYEFKAGDEVVPTFGPFQGITARFKSGLPGSVAKVMLMIWGKQVEVEINRAHLEPLGVKTTPVDEPLVIVQPENRDTPEFLLQRAINWHVAIRIAEKRHRQ